MNVPNTTVGHAIAAGQTGELQRIVRVNEHIKTVVATAFSINLMALNAIFLAKQAGQSALGFGVLSNELRSFAVDLGSVMKTLRGLTSASVTIVSSRLRCERTVENLSRLRDVGVARGEEAIDAAIARNVATLETLENALRERQRSLNLALDEMRQRVDLGGVLARSAKIEAAYGGSFAEALTQVSNDFDRTVESIRKSLDALAKT